MSAAISLAISPNRLLAALPAEDYQRLLPHLQVVDLAVEPVLHGCNEPVEYLYFLHQAVVSLVSTLPNRATVEVGVDPTSISIDTGSLQLSLYLEN